MRLFKHDCRTHGTLGACVWGMAGNVTSWDRGEGYAEAHGCTVSFSPVLMKGIRKHLTALEMLRYLSERFVINEFW